jgi:acetoin utilization deacetylase AcuC-like enzyme
VDHPVFREHRTGAGHPESPQRLIAIENHLRQTGMINNLIPVEAIPIDPQRLSPIHREDYIREALNFCRAGDGYIPSMEVEVGPATAEAALRAAGGCVNAAMKVLEGELDSAFCAVRPPGHHATHNMAMGFCLFNNIAVTAHHLLERGLSRILILDWDLHHGNGTQAAFYDNPKVLFISLHQRGIYPPGSGYEEERGAGAGVGFNWNIPLEAGTGHDEIMKILKGRVAARVMEFQPEFILISAGFDGHRDDYLGSLAWEEKTYAEATRLVRQWAKASAQDRVVSILEGGYNTDALASSVEAHLQVLLET